MKNEKSCKSEKITTISSMKTELFDYSLPPEKIAQHPLEPRDSSRLLVIQNITPSSSGD